MSYAGLLVLALAIALAYPAFAQNTNISDTKSGFVTTADGIKIHYIDAGMTKTVGDFRVGGPPLQQGDMSAGKLVLSNMRQQPAILFVPGWTMPGDIWEKQIAYFAKTHRVVAMDPRSQGESTKATDGHYPAARARDIKAVVDQLKLAPVVLVGWSMGVGEATAYVDQFGTDTLAGLVLVDGIAGLDMSPEMGKGFLTYLNNMQKDRRKTTDDFVRSMYKTPQTEEYLKHITEASLATPTNTAVTLGVSTFWTDNRPALAKIDKPTLIVVAVGGTLHDCVRRYAEAHRRLAPGEIRGRRSRAVR